MDFLLEIEDQLVSILENVEDIDDPDEEAWLLRRSIQVVLETLREEIVNEAARARPL